MVVKIGMHSVATLSVIEYFVHGLNCSDNHESLNMSIQVYAFTHVLLTQPSAPLLVRIMEPVHHLVYVTVQMKSMKTVRSTLWQL